MKKILIAIPTAKYVEAATFKSIFELEVPDGYIIYFEYFYGYNIAQIRNLIVDHTIKNGYDYLLAVDSDMVLPRDTLIKLLNVDKGVVSGVYRQRKLDTVIPEIYISNEYGVVNIDIETLNDSDDVIKVEACGFGGVLIKKEVLINMSYPHFVYKDAISIDDTISEDVYFCNKAKLAGYETYCVTTLRYGHIGEFTLET